MLKKHLIRLSRDQKGATAIEYGLIVSLIVIGLLAGFINLANTTTGLFNNVANDVEEASN